MKSAFAVDSGLTFMLAALGKKSGWLTVTIPTFWSTVRL
jgi:hypothetical protein